MYWFAALFLIFVNCSALQADDDFDYLKKTDVATAKMIRCALNKEARAFYKSKNEPPHKFSDFACYKKDIDLPYCQFELRKYQKKYTNVLVNKDFNSRHFQLTFKDGTIATYRLTRRKVFVDIREPRH